MRARARRTPSNARLRFAGAASAGGENLRTVSAIVSFQIGFFVGVPLVDRRAQVVLHEVEATEQRVELRGLEPRQRRRHQVVAERGELLEQRSRGRREEQPLGAAVVRVGPPLDQAIVGEAVEQPRQRDRLQVEHLGELGLLEALEAVEPRQYRPFGPRHAEAARLVVGVGPQQASYIIDRQGQFSIVLWHWWSHLDATKIVSLLILSNNNYAGLARGPGLGAAWAGMSHIPNSAVSVWARSPRRGVAGPRTNFGMVPSK